MPGIGPVAASRLISLGSARSGTRGARRGDRRAGPRQLRSRRRGQGGGCRPATGTPVGPRSPSPPTHLHVNVHDRDALLAALQGLVSVWPRGRAARSCRGGRSRSRSASPISPRARRSDRSTDRRTSTTRCHAAVGLLDEVWHEGSACACWVSVVGVRRAGRSSTCSRRAADDRRRAVTVGRRRAREVATTPCASAGAAEARRRGRVRPSD